LPESELGGEEGLQGAGVTATAARPDLATRRWSGHRIAPERPVPPDDPVAAMSGGAPRPFSRTLFRTTVELAEVPTPHGPVEVRVADGTAEIESPVPVVVVRVDGSREELPAGAHRVAVR